jgi:hypothetical protein
MLAANTYRFISCPVGSWTGDLLRRQQAMQKLPKVADERLLYGPAIIQEASGQIRTHPINGHQRTGAPVWAGGANPRRL